MVGLTWLAYMTYVTGYQSGYRDGADMAMDKAEALVKLHGPAGDRVESDEWSAIAEQ